jgi:hypothetical protein
VIVAIPPSRQQQEKCTSTRSCLYYSEYLADISQSAHLGPRQQAILSHWAHHLCARRVLGLYALYGPEG